MNDKIVILKPLVNEKSMNLKDLGLYTFLVSKNSTKSQIEKVVEEKFKVDVLSVAIVNILGKVKRQRKVRGTFTTGGYKKAIVKVKKNQSIALFESAAPEEEVEVVTAEGEKVATVKEKKSLLKGTKVKIEKEATQKKEVVQETGVKKPSKTSQKETKKGER